MDDRSYLDGASRRKVEDSDAHGGQPIPRTDFVSRRDAESYAIALDPSGKLRWKSGAIDEEHVITVLSERVPDDYLAFLRSKGVSYLFGGATDVNLKRVLHKLATDFGIETLLLEGGVKINGAFLAADLVDELSLLVAPIADGTVGAPPRFDAKEGKGLARPLKLVSVEESGNDTDGTAGRKGDDVFAVVPVACSGAPHARRVLKTV